MQATTIRIAIAQKIKKVCLAVAPKNIAAIAITGSTAINCADVFSDLEFAIFWHSIPTLTIRDQIIALLNGKITRRISSEDTTYWMGVDNIIAHQFCIDLIHNTKALFERRIQQVIGEIDLNVEQKLLFVLANCHPIYGTDFLQGQQQQISPYPAALQNALFLKHTRFRPLGGIVISAVRNDSYNFYHQLNGYVQEIMILLFALNKQYFPVKLKHIPHHFSQLPIQPKQLAEKYALLYTEKPIVAYQILTDLIAELFDLIEQTYTHPQIEEHRIAYQSIRRRYWKTEKLKHWPEQFHYISLEQQLKTG